MSHYIIAQIEIADREEYGKYESGFMDIFIKYQGKLLSVDEEPQLLEGFLILIHSQEHFLSLHFHH